MERRSDFPWARITSGRTKNRVLYPFGIRYSVQGFSTCVRRLSLTVEHSTWCKDNDFSAIARASQEILLYLLSLSRDGITYCEGVFRLPH